jgi:hypothetical protein
MGRFSRVVATFLCLVVCGAVSVEAQFGRNKVHYDRLDFRVLQTEHFDIYYYAEKEDAARQAGRMAERWYARFSELFGHSFARRQPLVLYASHPHFSQTNLTPGTPGEGTGGFIEAGKSRIAMPFAAGLGETDHVLGHEIAHAFQIDIARSVRQNAFAAAVVVHRGHGRVSVARCGHAPHDDVAARRGALRAAPDRSPARGPAVLPLSVRARALVVTWRGGSATRSSGRCCVRGRAAAWRGSRRPPASRSTS